MTKLEKAQAPFAGFENFAACRKAQIKKGKSEKSADKICGDLQKRAEGIKEWLYGEKDKKD